MILQINGDERTFPDPSSSENFTLASLIEALNMKPDRIAVELNLEIVQRDSWGETLLKEGDRLEIVQFVGGGLPEKQGKTLETNALSVPAGTFRCTFRYA